MVAPALAFASALLLILFDHSVTTPHPRGEVPEWSNGAVSKTVVPLRVPRVRIPLSPPLSCSEPEMRLPLGAFFFLFQRRLAEAAEPRRLAPGRVSVSERPSVSNRANLVRPGSASRMPMFSICFGCRGMVHSALDLPAGVRVPRTRSRRVPANGRAPHGVDSTAGGRLHPAGPQE